MTTDRLSLANALADANIERNAAERIATEIFDAIHDHVATKADIAAVRGDLQRVEAGLEADTAAVRADLQRVEAGLNGEFETRLAQLEHRLTVIGVRALVAVVGIVLAAIRYLPHSQP